MQYYVVMEKEDGIEIELNEPLWQNINRDRLFFPIHHGNSRHFSLLVMDNIKMEFIHMNSMRPTKGVKKHFHHKNAAKVVRDIYLQKIVFNYIYMFSFSYYYE
jgi:hypothetical protein